MRLLGGVFGVVLSLIGVVLGKVSAASAAAIAVDVKPAANVKARAIKSDRGIFLWINNCNGGAQNNFQVKVGGAGNAAYEWKTFDTWKGAYGSASNVNPSNGELAVNIPTLAAGADMALWFADKTPVGVVSRETLPNGWSATFHAASGRLQVANVSADGAQVRYALVDMAGRAHVSGALDVAGNGSAERTLDLGGRKAGVYGLRVSVGSRSVTRRVVLAAC